MNIGKILHSFAKKIWQYNRSLTGDGNRKTLKELKKVCNLLKIKEIKSGKRVFDWTIPKEWKVNSAFVVNPKGKKILDFSKNNLHLVGYSKFINKKMKLSELNKNLFSLPNQPNAIPYVTSYYNSNWGFCIDHNSRKKLIKGIYHVKIDTKLFNGSMSYGEIIIRGRLKKEIFLSTYICHPSMANNELSGPTVTIHLAKWLMSQKNLKYSYRIVFLPETIGSLAYLSKNLKIMKKNIIAGYNITCVGDNRIYSYLPSRNENTISDKIALNILKWNKKKFRRYSWKDRGSDERQYCSPGIDLPIASVMRTKYGEYPEYHTSLDNLKNVVTPSGLEGGFKIYQKIITALENNVFIKSNILGEPHLSKRKMYSTISSKNKPKKQINFERLLLNVMSYSDGKTSLLEISEKCNQPLKNINKIVQYLKKKKLIRLIN